MWKRKKNEKSEQEEPEKVLPEDVGDELELKSEDQEAVEAMRKFTDEDNDDDMDFSVKSILGGDFLMSKFMMKQVMFVIFCVVLMILYTGNRYDSQQNAILIDSLRMQLQDVKYNVLTQSSELMNLTRQSNVERMMKAAGDSMLHNSITPPYLIKADGKRQPANNSQQPKEVIIDSVKQDSNISKNNEI